MGEKVTVHEVVRLQKKKRRISKNKKVHWRKGVDVQDVENCLNEQHFDELEGGLLTERKDEDLFQIDCVPESQVHKLTRRQMKALQKRLQKSEPLEPPKPSKRELKRSFPKKKQGMRRGPKIFSESMEKKSVTQLYDLWDCNDAAENKKEFAEIDHYYQRGTKKKQPQESKTLKRITSALPAVEIADAGASYNPSLTDYLKYVNGIAVEEAVHDKKVKKLERQLSLAPGQKYITQDEALKEIAAGLSSDESDSERIEQDRKYSEKDNDVLKSEEVKPKKLRKQTSKKPHDLGTRRIKKARNEINLVYANRRLNKEIDEALSNREEAAEKRKATKVFKRYTVTRRLGRGKFEPYEKPVLLTKELPASLREIDPQGSVLLDRLKSLQKRSMMSVPGEKRTKSKLKKKLRLKTSEKRSHQEVMKGSRVI